MPRIKYNKDGTRRKKLGRPKKVDIEAKTKGNRGAVGRPKGDAAIMNEFKARLLNSAGSRRVLDTIVRAAQDDTHKNQAAAWKLIMDRIAPVAGFERDVVKAGHGNQINISISGVPGVAIDGGAVEDPIDGEFTSVTPGGDEDA